MRLSVFALIWIVLLFVTACSSSELVVEEEKTHNLTEQLESEGYVLIDKLKTPLTATNLTTTQDTLVHLADFLNKTA